MANVLRGDKKSYVEWWLEIDSRVDILVRADAGTGPQTVAVISKEGIWSATMFNRELLDAFGLNGPGKLPYLRQDDDEYDDEYDDDEEEEEGW